MNVGVQISELVFSFSLDKGPEVELLDYMIVVLVLISQRTSILFSIVTVPVYIPI